MTTVRHDLIQADSLADYICEYLDGEMDQVIIEVFQEYMAHQPELAEFVRKAAFGKQLLELLRDPANTA